MTSFLVIRNWERHQHYKGRSAPPWIKLYRDMLTSESWVLGTDRTRVIQLASMMLAPRYNNRIPYRFDLCKKVMSLDCSEAQFAEAVQHLLSTEFLEIQDAPSIEQSMVQDASALLAKCSSEESRGDKRRVEKIPPTPQGGAITVFEHWQKVFGHPKAILDGKRRRLIETQLQQFSTEDLCTSIDGYRVSPFHQGQNKDGKVYDGLELILRDAQHVEEGLRFLRNPPRPPPVVEQLSPVERVLRANGGVKNDERVVAEQFGSSNAGVGVLDGDVRDAPYAGFRRIGS
jgi:hypothetical protein